MDEIKLHNAIVYASEKHNGQVRKGTQIPYIAHILEVSNYLEWGGCEEDTVIAGILHDTIEDTDATVEELNELFGARVADLVAHETEDKTKSWKERKQATIDGLKTAPMQVKQICCADKLSNIVSMYVDYSNVGEKLWERFNAPKTEIAWYYKSVVQSMKELGAFKPYILLQDYCHKVFN